jgi:hypothetical protein
VYPYYIIAFRGLSRSLPKDHGSCDRQNCVYYLGSLRYRVYQREEFRFEGGLLHVSHVSLFRVKSRFLERGRRST